jgi:hypothetical protein
VAALVLLSSGGTGAVPAGPTEGGSAALKAEGSPPASSGTQPAGQWGSQMIYDASDGYYLLFAFGRTWSFTGGVWTEMNPAQSPPTYKWTCLTYDWRDGYAVLYGGGSGGIGTPKSIYSDTWTYRGGVWTDVTNKSDSPPGLQYASCAYDAAPGAGYVLLFGGATGLGSTETGTSGPTIESSAETWTFETGRWTQITSESSRHPSARFGASMAYYSAGRYVVLYGGAANGTSTANGYCTPSECPHYNQTWKFAGGTWTNITRAASPVGTPPGRWEAAMSNDSAAGYLVIFGGQANGYKGPNATGNYTWAFAGTWTNITSGSALTPATRFAAAMACDPQTGTALMFSGMMGTGVNHIVRDTWAFEGGEWDLLYTVQGED